MQPYNDGALPVFAVESDRIRIGARIFLSQTQWIRLKYGQTSGQRIPKKGRIASRRYWRLNIMYTAAEIPNAFPYVCRTSRIFCTLRVEIFRMFLSVRVYPYEPWKVHRNRSARFWEIRKTDRHTHTHRRGSFIYIYFFNFIISIVHIVQFKKQDKNTCTKKVK